MAQKESCTIILSRVRFKRIGTSYRYWARWKALKDRRNSGKRKRKGGSRNATQQMVPRLRERKKRFNQNGDREARRKRDF
jgi:hypothetical protein